MTKLSVSFAVFLLSAAPIHATFAGSLRTVALSDDRAPGTPDGVTFRVFDIPVLNTEGQTAFGGFLRGREIDLSNAFGIWSEGRGSLSRVAQAGSQAPGMASVVKFSEFGRPTLNSAGATAFRASLAGGEFDDSIFRGIWSDSLGSLGLIARSGDDATGAPDGVTFRAFGDPLLNSSGQTAFVAILTNSDSRGIWVKDSDTLRMVAGAGSGRPDLAALNSSGQTAYRVVSSGIGFNNSAIRLESGGMAHLVARAGLPAPGTEVGVSFHEFGVPSLNSAGQVAFNGELAGNDIDHLNDRGVWFEDSGVIRMVAREGSAAPGPRSAPDFFFLDDPVLNSAGRIAFRGAMIGSAIDNSNNEGVWSEGTGELRLIAREGDRAPGTTSGVTFRSFEDPVLNSAGQTAFLATLIDADNPFANARGIWAEDRAGVLRLIARQGDQLEVAPGDYRTIGTLQFFGSTGNEDGRPSGFNDRGQLAFLARFNGQTSGIFVSNAVAVPEPKSIVLALVALVTTTGLARRQRSVP